MTGMFLWIVIVILIIAFVWLFFYFIPLGLWFSAVFARCICAHWSIDRNANQEGASFHYYQRTGKCHKSRLKPEKPMILKPIFLQEEM